MESANDPVHTIAVNKTSYVFCLFVNVLLGKKKPNMLVQLLLVHVD